MYRIEIDLIENTFLIRIYSQLILSKIELVLNTNALKFKFLIE